MKDQVRIRRVSFICLVAMLAMLAIHIELLVSFNSRRYESHGNNADEKVNMEIDAREDSTSTWLKRGFELEDGRVADLIGATIDGELVNRIGDQIEEWSLQINISEDCFINQGWNGEMEIHQFVGTDKEKVQKMNLQDYELEDVELEYRYDGDLLIPLQKGDFILYYPNETFKEMPVKSGDDVKIGMIFYYLDQLDLSDYVLEYRLKREFIQGPTFIILLIITVLWVLVNVVYGVSMVAYRQMEKEMELRKSSLSSMSDIYDVIYIVDLNGDELTPVSGSEIIEQNRKTTKSARKLLIETISSDAADTYKDILRKFMDFDTLPERLSHRESVVCEFLSKTYGWSSMRFFAMDRREGQPLIRVIFAIQNIDEEKKELNDIAERIDRVKSLNEEKSALLADVSRELRLPIIELLSQDERIIRESKEENIRGYAQKINSLSNRMLMLIESIEDNWDSENGDFRVIMSSYSLRDTISDALNTARFMAEEKQLSLTSDVSDKIPDELTGDAARLKEILFCMLADAIEEADSGSVKLSVYSKALEGREHLLFSVRSEPDDTASSPGGIRNDSEEEAASGLNLELARRLLKLMGSELRTVYSTDQWKESYFEIEQKTAFR